MFDHSKTNVAKACGVNEEKIIKVCVGIMKKLFLESVKKANKGITTSQVIESLYKEKDNLTTEELLVVAWGVFTMK